MFQIQNDMATIENAKPEMPCTSPAMAAPIARIHMSLIDETYLRNRTAYPNEIR